jgi:hypothetical protein
VVIAEAMPKQAHRLDDPTHFLLLVCVSSRGVRYAPVYGAHARDHVRDSCSDLKYGRGLESGDRLFETGRTRQVCPECCCAGAGHPSTVAPSCLVLPAHVAFGRSSCHRPAEVYSRAACRSLPSRLSLLRTGRGLDSPSGTYPAA